MTESKEAKKREVMKALEGDGITVVDAQACKELVDEIDDSVRKEEHEEVVSGATDLNLLLKDYKPHEGRAKLDMLPFEVQKEVLDMSLGVGGKKKNSAEKIRAHLKKEYGLSITAEALRRWLRNRNASLYQDMMSAENENIIKCSYAELLKNFTEANQIMSAKLKELQTLPMRKGTVAEMKLCFDALASGLAELRSHMEDSKTSDYRSTKKLVEDLSAEVADLGIEELKESDRSGSSDAPV